MSKTQVRWNQLNRTDSYVIGGLSVVDSGGVTNKCYIDGATGYIASQAGISAATYLNGNYLEFTPITGDLPGANDGDIWYDDSIAKFRKKQNGVISNLSDYQLAANDIDTSGTGPWSINPANHQIISMLAGDPGTLNLPALDSLTSNIVFYVSQDYLGQTTLDANGTDTIRYNDSTPVGSVILKGNLVIVVGIVDTIYGSNSHWKVIDVHRKEVIPSGGTTGQVLSKVSSTDYDVTWTTPSGAGGLTVITGTINADFGIETDRVITTVANASITNALLKTVSFLPIETSATSLDDFMLNGVQMNIENIIDNTSFDIRATASNNASGIYQFKYIINI